MCTQLRYFKPWGVIRMMVLTADPTPIPLTFPKEPVRQVFGHVKLVPRIAAVTPKAVALGLFKSDVSGGCPAWTAIAFISLLERQNRRILGEGERSSKHRLSHRAPFSPDLPALLNQRLLMPRESIQSKRLADGTRIGNPTPDDRPKPRRANNAGVSVEG